jgi:hypothetical protein
VAYVLYSYFLIWASATLPLSPDGGDVGDSFTNTGEAVRETTKEEGLSLSLSVALFLTPLLPQRWRAASCDASSFLV